MSGTHINPAELDEQPGAKRTDESQNIQRFTARFPGDESDSSRTVRLCPDTQAGSREAFGKAKGSDSHVASVGSKARNGVRKSARCQAGFFLEYFRSVRSSSGDSRSCVFESMKISLLSRLIAVLSRV